MEIWKDVVGFEGRYQVSNIGRIKSIKKNHPDRILRPATGSIKYLKVCLINKMFLVHRLVAIAFHDNPLKKEFVNHKDGNKLNNEAVNLEWCTRQENIDHGYSMGLMHKAKGINHHKARLTESDVRAIRALSTHMKLSMPNIGRMFSMPSASIRSIVLRHQWKHVI